MAGPTAGQPDRACVGCGKCCGDVVFPKDVRHVEASRARDAATMGRCFGSPAISTFAEDPCDGPEVKLAPFRYDASRMRCLGRQPERDLGASFD